MQFEVGQEVTLVNAKSQRMKLALGTVSGISKEHKWHGKDIPKGWFRVDMREILHPNMPLMVENLVMNQVKLVEVVGANVIWDSKNMRPIPLGNI